MRPPYFLAAVKFYQYINRGLVSQFLLQVFNLLAHEDGDDLVEYTLIVATILIAGAAMFLGMQGSANTIWSAANNQLGIANN